MKQRKFKLHDQVRVIGGEHLSSLELDDVGIITEIDDYDDEIPYRVTVVGKENKGNWMTAEQLELIKR